MNKKIESLQKEIRKIESAREAKITKIEGEIAAIDKETAQCDTGMKEAVDTDDFAAFEKLGARKAFLQNRREMFEAALKSAKYDSFNRADYDRLKKDLITAIHASAEEVKKELVKHSTLMGFMGDDLDAEKETVRSLLVMIAEWAGVKGESYPLDSVVNTVRWACDTPRSFIYANAVKDHPEWVPTKK